MMGSLQFTLTRYITQGVLIFKFNFFLICKIFKLNYIILIEVVIASMTYYTSLKLVTILKLITDLMCYM